jgi:hypothetical protein
MKKKGLWHAPGLNLLKYSVFNANCPMPKDELIES